MTNPDIGRLLGISPRTAKAHVAAILDKLGAADRTEAVARAFERGLLKV
jgi:DNA-binding NarL/FixJ family response regulator